MSVDVSLPPAMFELEDLAPETGQHVEEYWWAPIVRAHVIHSTDLDLEYWCADDHYGYLDRVPARHDAWVWHCCSQPPGHIGLHVCDRCDHTWDGQPTRHLSTLPRSTR